MVSVVDLCSPLFCQHCLHHLRPGVSSPGLYGGQDGKECDLGDDSCGHYARRSHDAGVHFLEPVDRHGNSALPTL